MHEITLVIIQKQVAGVTAISLSRFAMRARRAMGLEGAVNVLITSSRKMRELNRRFRRIDDPTDVLSFPSAVDGFAGDIAISAEIARANGNELGHGVLTELKILILHGMLHLAGYDHESDTGLMSRKERRIRQELGLPGGLIERSLPASANAKGIASRKQIRIRRPLRTKAAGRAGRRKQ